MFSERAFFTFVRLDDPAYHHEYNAWHALDHRPENLSLPGVAWGDRWKLTDDCKAVAFEPDEYLRGSDYVAMYWFRPPYDESLAAWNKLAEDSFRWGRLPQIPGLTRPLRGFYQPVRGYAARRILVDHEVLPFRPNRGLYVVLTRNTDPYTAATHELHRWHDQDRLPALLDVPGVAGIWTFSLLDAGTRPWDADAAPAPGKETLRLTLFYLDEDPVDTALAIRARETELDAAGRGAPSSAQEELLVSFPVRAVDPWA